jgi:ribonuclease VapC
VIALIRQEEGWEVIRERLHHSVISTVNISEVIHKMVEKGTPLEKASWIIRGLQIESAPFDDEQALLTASLHQPTRKHGVSLGDRACLALGLSRGWPVLTGDRRWRDLDVRVKVELFR